MTFVTVIQLAEAEELRGLLPAQGDPVPERRDHPQAGGDVKAERHPAKHGEDGHDGNQAGGEREGGQRPRVREKADREPNGHEKTHPLFGLQNAA